MISSKEFKQILDGDTYLNTYMNILEDIAYQGFSKFTLSNDYDFFRVYDMMKDEGFNVEHNLKHRELTITL